jgi:uncharacterized phiE125 gp8 family phage protein
MRWLEPEITTQPTSQPVSLTDLKRHLRLGAPGAEDQYTVEDPGLTIALAAAQAYVEQFTGLSLAEQTVKLRAWGFDCREFRLPVGPASAVTSITYLDTNGAEQTLSTDVYVAALYGLSPIVSLAFNQNWPAHLCQPGSVTVTVTAGFADDKCPAPIRQAILLYAGAEYFNREATVIDASRVTIIENSAADRLLANYRRAYV